MTLRALQRWRQRSRTFVAAITRKASRVANLIKYASYYHCRCAFARAAFAVSLARSVHFAAIKLVTLALFEWHLLMIAVIAFWSAPTVTASVVAVVVLLSLLYKDTLEALGAIPEALSDIRSRAIKLRDTIKRLRAEYEIKKKSA